MSNMSDVDLVLLLLVATTLLAVLAQRLQIAYPIVLVIGGAALGLVPGLPRIALDPKLVFELFLPPLLFSGAVFMPWPEFKAHLRPILLLAVGLVGATTVAVAYVAWATIGLPPAVGFVLGAVVAPPPAAGRSRWAPCRARSCPRPTRSRRPRSPAVSACPTAWSSCSRAKA